MRADLYSRPVETSGVEASQLQVTSELSSLQAQVQQLRILTHDLARIAEHHTRQIKTVEAEAAALRAVVMQDRRVDLVRYGPFLNLMLREDMTYRTLPDVLKEQTIYDLETNIVSSESRITEDFLQDWRPGLGNILEVILATFSQRHGPVDFIDVGCQYGMMSMCLALFARSLDLDVRFTAFDCGVARHLAAFNFINNGFADVINFHPEAVGSLNGFVPVHRDAGHSEGNRIGGYISSFERGSTDEVVRCVTLDSLVERGLLGRPAVLKVDTEGAEPAVLRGARRIVEARPCAMVLEFTPSGFGHAVGELSPEQFLTNLAEDFHLLDVGRDHAAVRPVAPDQIEGFAREVREHPSGWTDLVLLDRQSEVCSELLERLSGA